MKWNGTGAKVLAFLVTFGILFAVYSKVDLTLVLERLADARFSYLLLALLLFLPQIWVSARRWQLLTTGFRRASLGESACLVLAGKALNVLVPSKLGELGKAYFLRRDYNADSSQAVLAVILEKVLNIAGLSVVLLVGVFSLKTRDSALWIEALIGAGALGITIVGLFLPLDKAAEFLSGRGGRWERIAGVLHAWDAFLKSLRKQPQDLLLILGLSILVWILHLLQFYLFFPALNQPVPIGPSMALLPLAILAGMLPFTIGGMGTRDTAILILFASYAEPSVLAGVGLLCSLRHWVDSLMGVPFLYRCTARSPRPDEEAA